MEACWAAWAEWERVEMGVLRGLGGIVERAEGREGGGDGRWRTRVFFLLFFNLVFFSLSSLEVR